MRTTNRRRSTTRPACWTVLAGFLMLTTILTACGGANVATTAPTATTSTSASAVPASAAPSSAPSPSTAATPTRAAQGGSPVGSQAPRTTPQGGSTIAPTLGPVPTAFPMKLPGIGYGMNVWLPTADTDRTLTLLKEAGFNWARQWISWESVETAPGQYHWEPLDKVVAAAEKYQVKLDVLLLRSPQWAGANGGIPKDKQSYGRFVGEVAKRYKGRIAAYEVWNEANLAGETGGAVNPGEYVELLKVAFPAIKAADPAAFVVFGGLTPTGINDPKVAIDDAIYLKQVYAYNNGEVKRYFDVLGVHANATNNPPETLWPDQPGPGPGYFDSRSFYFRRVEDLRKVMEEGGDGQKQVWVTEFGWTTKNAAKGYEYGQYVSEEQQAEYLVNAFAYAQKNWPWVGAMFLWNLNFSTVSPPTDEKTPWSILYADYSPRPAYDALKKMPKR